MPPCQVWAVTFLSTLSLRRATVTGSESQKLILHFYPRSPCGERPPVRDIIQWEGIFLSTLSLRRATWENAPFGCIFRYFYPRSPCGERLLQKPKPHRKSCNFYPRSPCGERLAGSGKADVAIVFLSTLSLRRATMHIDWLRRDLRISIHALLAESDLAGSGKADVAIVFLSTLSLRRATCLNISKLAPASYFYPRSPCGERPRTGLTCGGGRNISIHALLAESDYQL